MINECFIQFELKNYSQFIINARNLLFQNLYFVLEPDNVNGLYKTFMVLFKYLIYFKLSIF